MGLKEVKAAAKQGMDTGGGRAGIAPGATKITQEVFYDLGMGLRFVRTEVTDFFKQADKAVKNFIAMNCNQEGSPPIGLGEEAYMKARADAKRRGEAFFVKNPDDPTSLKAESDLINMLFDTAIISGMGQRANPAKMPDNLAHFFEED